MVDKSNTPRPDSQIPGDPVSSPPPEAPKPKANSSPPLHHQKQAHELLGIPNDPPADIQQVVPAQNLFEREEPITDKEFDEALLGATRGIDMLGALRRKLGAWPLLVFISCAVILFLISQMLTFVNQLQTLPEPVRLGGYAVLTLLVVGIMWALWRLTKVFARVRTTPRVQVEALRKLSQRAELRRQANARLHQAKSTLLDFLAQYPLTDRSEAVILLGKCLNDADGRTFRANAQALLTEESSTTEGWLEQFDRQFLGYLDAAARNRISQYAKLVGVKTAALPSGLDTPVVLLNAYLLAGDLCIIYNLRTTGTGTVAILARVLFNAFAASQASEWTQSAADLLFEGGGVVAGAAKAVASRAAEGGANYFLFRRLGAAMVRYLRPIWPPHK